MCSASEIEDLKEGLPCEQVRAPCLAFLIGSSSSRAAAAAAGEDFYIMGIQVPVAGALSPGICLSHGGHKGSIWYKGASKGLAASEHCVLCSKRPFYSTVFEKSQ